MLDLTLTYTSYYYNLEGKIKVLNHYVLKIPSTCTTKLLHQNAIYQTDRALASINKIITCKPEAKKIILLVHFTKW